MDSISKRLAFVQGVKMSYNELGFCATFKGLNVRGNQLDGVKRGCIHGFSRASVRRLRETLYTRWIPNAKVYGLTLTVPWRDMPQDIGAEFRRSWMVFQNSFTRRYPHSSLIWRIELQQRGAPHIHAIVYFSSEDGEFDNAMLLLLWKNSINLFGGSLDCFLKHGVKVEPLDDCNYTHLMRYLCDHASKRKQAQIGWKGRQWGVIGSRNLCDRQSNELSFPDPRSEGYFRRLLRHLTSYWRKDERAPFGLRRVESRRRWGVSFTPGGGETVRAMYQAALSH